MSEIIKGELQYKERVKFIKERGIERLGLSSGWAWYDDPKHLLFTFSRYKFIAKMFSGFDRVLEVGCGDGFASRIVAQAVGSLTCVDFDINFINDAKERITEQWQIDYYVWDALEQPIEGKYKGVFALDVLEHIPSNKECNFIENIISPLIENGVLIIGMPSIHSQAYASPQSAAGHINCKTQRQLQELMSKYFENVFVFSMNDEVIHTGHSAMAHYFLALCCGKK